MLIFQVLLEFSLNQNFAHILATKVQASIVSPQFPLLAEQPILVAPLGVAWPYSHLVFTCLKTKMNSIQYNLPEYKIIAPACAYPQACLQNQHNALTWEMIESSDCEYY